MDDRGAFAVGLIDNFALQVHRGEHVTALKGTTSSTTRSATRSRSPMARGESSIPAPVRADATTASSCALARRVEASGARSALLITSSSGTAPASISSRTVRYRLDLHLGLGRRRIHHVDQEIRVLHHLEGGAEGLDELMRELADEPDGV